MGQQRVQIAAGELRTKNAWGLAHRGFRVCAEGTDDGSISLMCYGGSGGVHHELLENQEQIGAIYLGSRFRCLCKESSGAILFDVDSVF